MPRLDGTGPAGMGPMTGGAYRPTYGFRLYGQYPPAYGFGRPRWGRRGFWGRGMAWGGRGRGRRWW